MKKFLVLLIMLVTATMLGCAMAEERPTVYTCGDYEYVLLEDGTAEILNYTAKATDVTIPAEIDGHRVTSFGEQAFWHNVSITIPNSVTSISTRFPVFHPYLVSIKASPDHPTLATIDGVLFEKSTKTLICYPSAINAQSYSIPQGIRIIGDNAFYECRKLTSVTIPDSVTSIGDNAFYECRKLTSVTIPDSVTSIGDNAFRGCRELTSVTIPDSVTTIGDNAFRSCRELISVTIPDSVTTIGDSAFGGCTALTSITIPRSITAIDDSAFTDVLYLPALTDIYVSGDHPTLASVDGVLFDKSTNTLLCFPCASDITNYIIPQETRIIGDKAFNNCRSLTTITIPDSVTTIGDSAFWNCDSLTTITIPDSVTSIGDSAFSNCRSLTAITIPDSVTSIGDSAFSFCSKLTSVTVGLNSYARQYCIDNNLPYTYPDANDWLLN